MAVCRDYYKASSRLVVVVLVSSRVCVCFNKVCRILLFYNCLTLRVLLLRIPCIACLLLSSFIHSFIHALVCVYHLVQLLLYHSI